MSANAQAVPTTQDSNNNNNSNNAQESSAAATGDQCPGCRKRQLELDKLSRELDEWKARCRLAEEDSRRARDELRSLENEMEEMHDNFREEESEQFEQVKQELDACLKNCKILQIRLNKSERQYGQLEQVKQMLERQLEEQSDASGAVDGPRTEDHIRRTSSPAVSMQQDGEFVSVATREYDQLLRDLNDTSERERDLQEQIKYSQEEAQLKGERLQAIEAENEILLGRIQKLTLANSSLRSRMMSASGAGNNSQEEQQQQQQQVALATSGQHGAATSDKTRELCEQNEQLKLALEVAQAESQRVRARAQELQQTLEARDRSLKEVEAKLETLQRQQQNNIINLQAINQTTSDQAGGCRSSFELECRQLRARLAHSERQCRQLRSQCESSEQQTRRSGGGGGLLLAAGQHRSHSMEEEQQQQQQGGETVRSLAGQCKALAERNAELELKLQRLIELSSHNLDAQANMETDLFDKLKRQLDTSESELAKAKSRLVELDIECGRAQRQHKRLLGSLETCGSVGGELTHLRRNKLPAASDERARDSLSRAELRQAMRDLELDIDDLVRVVKAKECLIRELTSFPGGMSSSEVMGAAPVGPTSGPTDTSEAALNAGEQVKSLRRQLDQERLLSANLKLDVAGLEQDSGELRARCQLLERERVAMEAELDKMRSLLGEQRAELEESERERAQAHNKSRDLLETLEKLRLELAQVRQQTVTGSGSSPSEIGSGGRGNHSPSNNNNNTDLLRMSRDLSELKVKNGFLMRQLELARDDTARQLEDLRIAHEAQQRRSVELAQLELKERQLQESQRLRDELQETKQRFAHAQRQAARQEEEVTQERDRWRALERDWRRDKSQWQQTREQLEGQLAIEKRSSEFRLKEAEAAIRDKERSLTGVQERAVQLERDLKRLQNRYHLLEEDSESKCKQLTRDLEICTKNLHDLQRLKQERDEQVYEATKRLQGEKSTLKETLETIKTSYDEKLAEARQLRELLQVRQEQSYKDRTQQLERIEELSRRLNEASGVESQAKLLKQRLEIQERQLELVRRELAQVKEERVRLRARCDELEKHELVTKTSSISGAAAAATIPSHSFLKPFGSKSQFVGRSSGGGVAVSSQPPAASTTGKSSTSGELDNQQPLAERLSGKINDQRHLIDMLRQQLNETQLELRQLKLLQSNERSRWQTQVALLQSRLNECEEKLANETAMLARHASSQLMRDLVGPRLESSWTRERSSNQELIRQQQQQIEALARDLKKTSQAHDLLRLHSKQLESHNNKLSRKLIEYQQQSSMFKLADRELESNYEHLREEHAKLERHARPLIEIVAKIVNSLDAPEQVAPAKSQLTADSTERPLRAGAAAAAARVARQQQQQQQRDSDDSESELSNLSPAVSTPKPAHQVHQQQQQQQSRLTRLLAGGKSGQERDKPTTGAGGDDSLPGAGKRATPPGGKTVKRVRVKCSTLGITTGEKKLLKQQLKTLAAALEVAHQQPPVNSSSPGGADTTRPGSVTPTASGSSHPEAAAAANNTAPARPLVDTHKPQQHSSPAGSSANSQMSRVVHWQMDSDLESERSWSLEPTASTAGRTGDIYRRFPQATPSRPSSSGARGPAHSSLTDYESESSLASDYSVGIGGGPLRFHLGAPSSTSSLVATGANGGGTESDSGLLTGGNAHHLSGRKKTSSGGLKGRLTSTLRNLSRSITGGLGGSDTEADSSANYRREAKRAEGGKRASSVLKEIRV